MRTRHVVSTLDSAAFRAVGFNVHQTGGGCTAWRREINADRHVLVTGLDGCCHELAGETDRYLIGVHADDYPDNALSAQAATAAEAIDVVARLCLPQHPYTVILLHPDYLDAADNGHGGTCQSHEFADTPEEAFGLAQDRQSNEHGGEPIDWVVVAVFADHLHDLFIP